MSHTDKFGRVWKYTPAHDTDRMLKLPEHMAIVELLPPQE